MFVFFPLKIILGVPSIICPATTGTTLLLGSVHEGWEGTQIKVLFGASSIPTTYHITKLSATI